MIELIYGAFFLITLFAAIMVVLTPHTVYSALYLILAMVGIGGLFVMINAQLAAAFQVIVYAGAIMVLFMFVIMLLNLGTAPKIIKTRGLRPFGLLAVAGVAVQSLALCGRAALEIKANPEAIAEGVSFVTVGKILINDHIYLFEMTSVLLLVAVIGAIMLARKTRVAFAGEGA